MNISDELLEQFKSPIIKYNELTNSIRDASSFTPSKENLNALKRIISKLNDLERFTGSNAQLTTKDRSDIARIVAQRICDELIDGERGPTGWIIHSLKEKMANKDERKNPVADPGFDTLFEVNKVINDELEKLCLMAKKLSAMPDAVFKKEIDKQHEFLFQHPMLRSYYLEQEPLRPLHIAMAELHTFRTYFKDQEKEIEYHCELTLRSNQSTEKHLKVISLIDRLEDYLHKTGLIKTYATYQLNSKWARDGLWEKALHCSGRQPTMSDEEYIQHKSAASASQTCKYIDKIDLDLIACKQFELSLKRLTKQIAKLDVKPLITSRNMSVLDRKYIVIVLRVWWLETTGDRSRFTRCAYGGGYSGAFFKFVKAELKLLNRLLSDGKLAELVTVACDSVDPLYIDVDLAAEN